MIAEAWRLAALGALATLFFGGTWVYLQWLTDTRTRRVARLIALLIAAVALGVVANVVALDAPTPGVKVFTVLTWPIAVALLIVIAVEEHPHRRDRKTVRRP